MYASPTQAKIRKHLYQSLSLFFISGSDSVFCLVLAALTSARTPGVLSWPCLPFTSVHILLGSTPKHYATMALLKSNKLIYCLGNITPSLGVLSTRNR